MNLTKKKAIELSIELWTWLAETGEGKSEWPSWEQYGETVSHCFLCGYAVGHNGCGSCPYRQKFGNCCDDGTPFDRWYYARTVETKKGYARLFLKQLKQL